MVLGVSAAFIALALAGFAEAQIRTDGSFGPAHTFTGSAMTIGAKFGMLKGKNLFHSFSTFLQRRTEPNWYVHWSAIRHQHYRARDRRHSIIRQWHDRVQKYRANLVLVNPTGWIFGPKASLSVSGSVHISTADAVRFADGTSMPARTPDSSSLTVRPPTAFGFLGPNAGGIQVVGTSLPSKGPQAGKDLSLVGGPIRIEGTSLFASAGKIGSSVPRARARSVSRVLIASCATPLATGISFSWSKYGAFRVNSVWGPDRS